MRPEGRPDAISITKEFTDHLRWPTDPFNHAFETFPWRIPCAALHCARSSVKHFYQGVHRSPPAVCWSFQPRDWNFLTAHIHSVCSITFCAKRSKTKNPWDSQLQHESVLWDMMIWLMEFDFQFDNFKFWGLKRILEFKIWIFKIIIYCFGSILFFKMKFFKFRNSLTPKTFFQNIFFWQIEVVDQCVVSKFAQATARSTLRPFSYNREVLSCNGDTWPCNTHTTMQPQHATVKRVHPMCIQPCNGNKNCATVVYNHTTGCTQPYNCATNIDPQATNIDPHATSGSTFEIGWRQTPCHPGVAFGLTSSHYATKSNQHDA